MPSMQWLSSHSKSDPQVGLLKQKWERECGGRRGLDVDIYSWPGFPVRGRRHRLHSGMFTYGATVWFFNVQTETPCNWIAIEGLFKDILGLVLLAIQLGTSSYL